MDIFAVSVLIVRVLLLAVSIYNVTWSARWLRYLWRGERFPLSVLKVSIFLTSFGILSLQFVILGGLDKGADNGWALLGFVSILAGQILVALAHRTGWAEKLIDLAERSIVVDEIFELVGIAEDDE